MYKITARQILVIALISGLFAAGVVAVVDRMSGRLQPAGSAFTESPPAGVTDPSMATDEHAWGLITLRRVSNRLTRIDVRVIRHALASSDRVSPARASSNVR